MMIPTQAESTVYVADATCSNCARERLVGFTVELRGHICRECAIAEIDYMRAHFVTTGADAEVDLGPLTRVIAALDARQRPQRARVDARREIVRKSC